MDEPLSFDEIGVYPVHSGVYAAWTAQCAGDGLPVHLDPVLLPRDSFPALLVLEILDDENSARVRLAGSLADTLFRQPIKGRRVTEFLSETDARRVLDDVLDVARRREPSLTRRTGVSAGGDRWSYTRLMLPYGPGPKGATKVLQAVEPSQVTSMTGVRLTDAAIRMPVMF